MAVEVSKIFAIYRIYRTWTTKVNSPVYSAPPCRYIERYMK